METNPEFWSHRPLVEPVLPPYWSCWREAAERKELLLLPTSQTPNSSGTRVRAGSVGEPAAALSIAG